MTNEKGCFSRFSLVTLLDTIANLQKTHSRKLKCVTVGKFTTLLTQVENLGASFPESGSIEPH